jgi:hypothetical protein
VELWGRKDVDGLVELLADEACASAQHS